MHIAVFFDGTGNDRDADVPARKWSNVARMYDAALNEKNKSIHRIYVSGVGTASNGDVVRWLSGVGVWVQDNLGGMAAGAGGTRRLEQGDDAVNDRLRDVLIADAKTMGGKVAQYAAENGAKGFSELNAALSENRLIKIISRHMEVFFSANGTMYRQGIKAPGDRSREASEYKYLGAKGMAWEIGKYRAAVKAGHWVRSCSSAD